MDAGTLLFGVLLSCALVSVDKELGEDGLAERGEGHEAGGDLGGFDWLPPWRRKADCGPQSLFALMRLQGADNVSINDVAGLVDVNPSHGCSIVDLHRAAGALGLPTEILFVNPNDLERIPRPFILHGISTVGKNLGHFSIVVDYNRENREYAMIDPIFESFGWYPERSALHGFTGYVLVPVQPVGMRWWRWIGWSMTIVGACSFLIWAVIAGRAAFGRQRDVSAIDLDGSTGLLP
jgi:hypothetical protein